MARVDHHVHLYPPALNADPAAWASQAGEAHWAKLCLRRRRDGRAVQEFPSVDDLLRALDAAGLDRALLLGWYWEKPATCAWHNRALAAWARAHPDRLSAWATFHPGSTPEVVSAELHRARDEGLTGLGELSPQSVGSTLQAPGLQIALDLAEAWGWAVNFHVTDPASRPYPGRVDTPPQDFITLARNRPRLSLVLAHWAGGADVRALPNVAVDTAAAPLLYGDAAWSMVGRTARFDQVRFGSDYPLRLTPAHDAASGLATFASTAGPILAPDSPAASHLPRTTPPPCSPSSS